MSYEIVEWVVVGLVIVAAIVVAVRSFVKKKDPCAGCGLKERCSKAPTKSNRDCYK